jgi:hypothetical protein
MPYIIEAVHTSDRFLTAMKKVVVIRRLDRATAQHWDISDSDEPPFKIIRLATNPELVLVSPDARGNAITLSELATLQDEDLAKWDLVYVHQKYGTDYVGANEHDAALFIQVRKKPRRTTRSFRTTPHELGVDRESTHNDTPVILWNHKGLEVAEPRNHMWLLRAAITRKLADSPT